MSEKPCLGIKGVNCEIINQALAITSEDRLRVLSSAVLNGGLVFARSIVNYHVPKSFKNPNPARFLKEAVSRLGLPSPTVGLMTAVKMKNVSVKREQDGRVVSLVTAGLSYPAAAGDRIKLDRVHQGTINTILIIDCSLTASAMVEAAKTATEAKTLALRDLDVRSSFSGEVASGTTTDSICVACTGKGKAWRYAGTSTPVGQAIARTVREGVEEAIMKENGLRRNRPVTSRLTERGIRLGDLVDTGMELFVGSDSVTKEKGSVLLRRGLISALSDANVASLVIAAMRLDEDGKTGTISPLTAEAFLADPVNLVADETIGIAIANYISGTLGVHNFLYYDRMKPGITKKLGPFMDDAICGLVAGVMSKVLREES